MMAQTYCAENEFPKSFEKIFLFGRSRLLVVEGKLLIENS